MGGYQITLAKQMVNFDLLVGKFGMVLEHRSSQGRKACREEWVVVLSLEVDISLIGFVDLPCRDEL
jgi:hypothetical protein